MATPKRPTHGVKGTGLRRKQAAASLRGIKAGKGPVSRDARSGVMYYKQTGKPVNPRLVGQPGAASKKNPAGFNPFGVPASKMADSIINSQRKKP